MTGLDIFTAKIWHPFSAFGLTHPFFDVPRDVMINTWIVLGVLIIIVSLMRYALSKKKSILRFITLQAIRTCIDLVKSSMGSATREHVYFIGALFTFIFLCNSTPLLPFVEEPTKNLNTTIALGIISFVYVQYYSIAAHGIRNYLHEYFEPFFFLFPLHVIGKLATILSISFRLFGNIFGGAIISEIYLSSLEGSFFKEALGLGPNLILLSFFGVFESLLQAFVFTILTLTYLAIGVGNESHEEAEVAS